MYFKKTNARLTIFLCFLFATFLSYAGSQENSLSKAIQLFDDGKFTEAEQILKSLLDEKPDHLMVNYYYGACRTENGHYGTNEIIYLLNGSIGESPLKTDYYIAVQYHAKNRWNDALKHYTRFKGEATPEQQKEVQLSEKFQQCYEKINPFVIEDESIEVDVLPVAIPRKKEIEEYVPIITEELLAPDAADSTKITSIDSVHIDSVQVSEGKTDEEYLVTEKTVLKPEPINFIINGEIAYLNSSHFKTKKGSKLYTEGNKKQKELDITVSEIEELRKKYGSTNSYSEKQALGEKILNGETDIYKLQDETIQLFTQAKQEEIKYWNSAPSDEKEAFMKELDEYLKASQEVVIPEIEFDTTTYIAPGVLLAGAEFAPQQEGKNNDELIYKIQLGAYSRGLPNYVKNLFKKLSYIRKIENYTDEKGIVVYTTGNLTNYEDALKMQKQVRQEGVEDAFVVPYFNGKRITLKEAKEIEAGK